MSLSINVRGKIFIAVILPVVGMVAFALLDILDQRDGLLESRKGHVKHMVEVGESIMDRYRRLAEKGLMTDKEARERAEADIRDIRSGNGDYIFVFRSDGVLEVIGPSPQLEGTQLIDVVDSNGVPFTRRLIESAREGGGFVAYDFPRKAGDSPVPKISTALFYKPWDLVVCSGVYIDDIHEVTRRQLLRVGMFLTVAVILILGFSLYLVRSITTPLSSIAKLIERLSHGDKSITVPHVARRDEIGKVAGALELFRSLAVEFDQQADERRLAAARAAEAMASEKRAIAADFEARVMTLIDRGLSSSADMRKSAQTMSSAASKALTQASSAASAAEEATANVEAVASASEELYSSISEISRQVTEAAQISSEAASQTRQINATMMELDAAASRIGEVIGLVNNIASQTNLLALNATIEAARAGDAGKGFAVVAGEVKALAVQTARATEDITAQISSVQGETELAVQAIRSVGVVIERVQSISSGIASAVEEQGAATQEIARNVAQAAEGTHRVSVNVGGLADIAGTTETAAGTVLAASGDVADNAAKLREEIQEFLKTMREDRDILSINRTI